MNRLQYSFVDKENIKEVSYQDTLDGVIRLFNFVKAVYDIIVPRFIYIVV